MNNYDVKKPIYEFLLWNNCQNHCEFCHMKANRRWHPGKFPDDNGKLKSITLVKQFIDSGAMPEGSHVLFMGGELFDTRLMPDTRAALLSLSELVASKMLAGELGLFYVITNLIYEDTSLLFAFVDNIANKGMQSRIRFTTSYDIAYRFDSTFTRDMALRNMLAVSARYPEITRTANCVLTDAACAAFANNPELRTEFIDTYGFRLNPVPLIRLDDTMAPARSTVLTTLTKFESADPGFLDTYLASMACDQPRVLYEYNAGTLCGASAITTDCGHSVNYRRVYGDRDTCFMCDCKNLAATYA